MTDKFKVIEGNKDTKDINRVMRTVALYDCWERQYHNAIYKAMSENEGKQIADYSQHDLIKIAFAGIKYVKYMRKIRRENERVGTGYKQTLEESKAMFNLIDAIFMIMGYITVNNLVTTFSITKDFDGHKWGCKDYFYTMEELSKLDWDKPVGRDNLTDLLWDYQNKDLGETIIEYMCATSAMYRSQTGKDMAEEWLSDLGVPSYTINEDIGVMQNRQTGEIVKISNKPSHLQIVK